MKELDKVKQINIKGRSLNLVLITAIVLITGIGACIVSCAVTDLLVFDKFKADTNNHFAKIDSELNKINTKLIAHEKQTKLEFKSMSDLIVKNQEINQIQFEKLLEKIEQK